MTGPDDPSIREATSPELPTVLNVLDGGGLATDREQIRRALDGGDVLVAVAGDDTRKPDSDRARGRILGALVLDGEEITAVAVRRRRRDQGIGTRLVETAGRRRERLVAEFDPRVRPFWESLGFDISSVEGSDRYRGVR